MLHLRPTTIPAANGSTFELAYIDPLRNFADLVAELGGDPDALAMRAGLPAGIFAGGHAVSVGHIRDLLEIAAKELECPQFGMQLAARAGPGGMFGEVGEMMRDAENFGQAINLLAEHSAAENRSISIWARRYVDPAWVVIGYSSLTDGPSIRAQATEHTCLLGHLKLVELTGGGVRCRQMLFRHQPVASPQTYRRYFGCEVLFGQHIDAAVYYERDLAQPMAGKTLSETVLAEPADPGAHAPFRTHVRVIVTHFLGTRYCSRELVAESLRMHPRTMDRRLADEGTAFLEIKNQVRRDTMFYYLTRTDLNFVAVSQRLGFSEQSVMTRNCVKWFGKPPRAIRAARNADA